MGAMHSPRTLPAREGGSRGAPRVRTHSAGPVIHTPEASAALIREERSKSVGPRVAFILSTPNGSEKEVERSLPPLRSAARLPLLPRAEKSGTCVRPPLSARASYSHSAQGTPRRSAVPHSSRTRARRALGQRLSGIAREGIGTQTEACGPCCAASPAVACELVLSTKVDKSGTIAARSFKPPRGPIAPLRPGAQRTQRRFPATPAQS